MAVAATGVTGRAGAPGAARPRVAWTFHERHPVAAELGERAPSAALAARLVELDPAEQDEAAVLEGIAAWERLASWLAAQQARWIEALGRLARSGTEVDRIPDEVATLLGLTRRSAEARVALAAGLAAHPRLASALAHGLLSARKAEVLLAETAHLPRELADSVLDRVIEVGGERTVPQLRADVRAAELVLDAEAAAARHAEARRERCVWMVPAPDAMAWVKAFLPAADAATVMTALDGLAAARSQDDPRTADERRADALTDLARRVLDSGSAPDGTPLPVRQHRRPHLVVTVAASSGGAAGGGVAHLAGYGLVPVQAVSHLVTEADVRTVAVDGGGVTLVDVPGVDGYRPSAALARAVVDRDLTCRFPGCRVPADRCDLDHVVPFDPNRPARWQTVEQNLQALCRHHHRVKTHGGWSVSRDPVTGATLWRSPAGQVRIVSLEAVVPRPPPAAPA